MPPIRDNDDLQRIASRTDVPGLQKTLTAFMHERLNGRNQNDLSNAEMDVLFEAADKQMQAKHGISVWDAMLLINNSNSQSVLPDDTERKKRWDILYEKLSKSLGALGQENAYGDGDFWLVDDDYGDTAHKLCLTKLSFLQPQVIKAIQSSLRSYPDWRVLIQMEAELNGEQLPPEGLMIYTDHVEQHWDKVRFESLARTLGI
jgi:hypothetical protein